jgi:hypothetical protein
MAGGVVFFFRHHQRMDGRWFLPNVDGESRRNTNEKPRREAGFIRLESPARDRTSRQGLESGWGDSNARHSRWQRASTPTRRHQQSRFLAVMARVSPILSPLACRTRGSFASWRHGPPSLKIASSPSSSCSESELLKGGDGGCLHAGCITNRLTCIAAVTL